jgi:biopolymer transport protein ExbD
MRIRGRRKLLVEPPAVATGDIAFNLIVFFLVCASVQPSRGRPQEIPRSEEKQNKKDQSQSIEVTLTRTTAAINGQVVLMEQFRPRLRELLQAKPRPEDKIVVVKSKPEVPYHHWILVTGWIEKEGGTITLQVEEERTIVAP